jgi:hypothetical protein
MSLKTLKDLDDWNHHEGPQGNKWETRKTPEQLKEELKQEAINRWKEFKEEYMNEKIEKNRIFLWGRMEEIKEFNNLIGDDLK